MIEHLSISNFQAHRSFDADLGPITVLVGPSDVGKSSILRALRWILLNDAAADFTTWGEKATKVEAVVDGRTITRKKGAGNNYYSIDAGNPYDAVGKSVPDDVAALALVDDRNFQGQMDSPFWLSETAGEVSRQLNEAVDLDIIDKSLAFVASELRDARAEVKLVNARLEQAKEKRQALRWTEEAAADVEAVVLADATTTNLRDRSASLAKILTNVKTADRDRLNAGDAAVDGQVVIGAYEAWDRADKRAAALALLLANIGRTRADVDRVHAELAEAEAELAEASRGKCPVCGSEFKAGG